MKPGIYSGISNADYHADKDSYSSSLVKKMEIPAQAKHAMDNPQEHKDCFRIGSGIHNFILERDSFYLNYLTGISCPRRSKADKQSWADWFTEHGANGNEIIENPAAKWNGMFEQQSGRNLVTPEEIQRFSDMATSVASNKNAIELLEKGKPEQSVYWQDQQTGLNLRCRPDYLNDDFISDLKSCDSVSDHAITRSFVNYRYGISQAMYQDGVKQVLDDWRPFIFIFIDKNPPYLCRVISLDELSQQAGWQKYQNLLSKLDQCLQQDVWPSIPDNLEFTLPDWAA